MQQPRRIAIRGTNWLGDAVMSTPALLRLRERFPEARVALLTPEKLAALWTHHPAVDEVISFAPGENVFAVGRKLRETKSDLAVVLPNSPRAALEVWLARIPRRLGYARPWRNWFLTDAMPPRPGHAPMRKRTPREIRRLTARAGASLPIGSRQSAIGNPNAHQLHDYLHLVGALGANTAPVPPRLFVQADEIESAKGKFGLAGVTQPIFGLNPGAEYGPAKRWPVERFIAAAREIQTRARCVWILFGGAGDAPPAAQIEAQIRGPDFAIKNLAGKTSLRELMALLRGCRVLLTNDTGPMHVAAAVGTPVVALFGSTAPELTGPGLPGETRHRLLEGGAACSPCFRRECPIDLRCMAGIAAETVAQAVLAASRAHT